MRIVAVRDERENRETIGSVSVPVFADDPVPWVRAGCLDLARHGFTFVADASEGRAHDVDVTLRRLWVQSTAFRLEAVVVCRVQVHRAGGGVEEHTVQGRGGGATRGVLARNRYDFRIDQIQAELNEALADAVAQLGAKL